MTTTIDRDRAIARVVFLLPSLTDDGLERVLREVEQTALTHPRDLSSGTLAAEQATREASATRGAALLELAGYVGASGCPTCGNDPGQSHAVACSGLHDTVTEAALASAKAAVGLPPVLEPADPDDRGPREAWGAAVYPPGHPLRRRVALVPAPCPEPCDHSDAEHAAFDAGRVAGLAGTSTLDYPRSPPLTPAEVEAWLTGHSSGSCDRPVRS